jgi:hypothetical protein
MAALGLVYISQPQGQPLPLLNLINLIPNQLGHLVFSFFGGFTGYFGGPVVQVAFPLSLVFYLFTMGRPFASSLASFWTAQSLFEVARYARDARALTLTLVGGPDHVWHTLLSRLGLLDLDQFVGTLIYLTGVLTLFAALALGLFAARRAAA